MAKLDEGLPSRQVLSAVVRGLTTYAPLLQLEEPPDQWTAARQRGGIEAATPMLAVDRPAPVYVLTLAQVLEGEPLAQATLRGWRFLVESAAGPIGALEVGVDEGGKAREAVLREGPEEASALWRLQRERGDLFSATTAVRLLMVPALYASAIWLHERERDEVVPISGDPSERRTEFTVLDGAEFLARLHKLALEGESRRQAAGIEADDIAP